MIYNGQNKDFLNEIRGKEARDMAFNVAKAAN